ncbi:MAG: hypothetical protein A2698_01555 [Candidatus Levybacteria bacterium RIFCSPHIGHO2_01_FULL_42_15]|nr:MAG: hypothetical protein A2698_01555 [Candidatus Levybacteria bacterium RIFCSPHIGHO2_01_FULL_42_15]
MVPDVARHQLVSVQIVKFYYIYILYNSLKNFIYIGFSEDLKQRQRLLRSQATSERNEKYGYPGQRISKNPLTSTDTAIRHDHNIIQISRCVNVKHIGGGD